MKPCPTCDTIKPLTEFHKESKRADGHASQCKECRSVHYKSTYTARAPRTRELVRQYRQKNIQTIREAKNVPCTDCGKTYPYYVMDFDHLDGALKEGNLSRCYDWSPMRVAAEIAKCEVVCSNCHRIRTHARRG